MAMGKEQTRHGLTLERYAEIKAYLCHYSPERSGQVLAQMGLTPTQWNAAATDWDQTIEEDIARGQYSLVFSFAAKFTETQERLRAEQPELLPPREQPLPAAPAGAPPASSPVALQSYEITAYPAEPSRVEWAPHVPADVTADGLSAPSGDTLPFGLKPSPAFVAQMSAPGAFRALWESWSTGDTDVGAALEGDSTTLPFRRGDSPLTWTLEQFASICAELSVSPEKKEEILRRYRVDESGWRRQELDLQQRLAANARERERFHALLIVFQQWLAQRKHWEMHRR